MHHKYTHWADVARETECGNCRAWRVAFNQSPRTEYSVEVYGSVSFCLGGCLEIGAKLVRRRGEALAALSCVTRDIKSNLCSCALLLLLFFYLLSCFCSLPLIPPFTRRVFVYVPLLPPYTSIESFNTALSYSFPILLQSFYLTPISPAISNGQCCYAADNSISHFAL